MVTITGEYTGNLHCRSVHGPSGALLETDAPKDNQGQGAAFSPTDLCATSLITCMVTTMAIQARTSGFDFAGVTYAVHKHMTASPPRQIARLEGEIVFSRDHSPDEKVRLERAAKTCPVHRSLHPDVALAVTLRWADGSSSLVAH